MRKKTQLLKINATNQTQLKIQGKAINEVDDFTYLGSNVSKKDSTSKDIKSRIAKARNAFIKLNPIWKSNQYSQKLKLKLYNSNVKSVLLYASECWRVTKSDMIKLSTFHNSCLRRICRIFWPVIISNDDLYRQTHSKDIIIEIKSRRLRWLGHVLRMPQDSIPETALCWTPQGQRNRGRPKTTWRRTITTELVQANLTWSSAEMVAKDRQEWKNLIAALCSGVG
uniref:Uncharacterized protein LOC102806297 n=1 Tax=Saccoglossus kowalevskii TaxID=10224 RepID=A0ABM0MNX1_SACKO|nr:PREDICTED: uncharacterized protein LOC102806297 [Saccoglossus kowalevskii]